MIRLCYFKEISFIKISLLLLLLSGLKVAMFVLYDEACRKHLFDDVRVMVVLVRLAFRRAQLLLQVSYMCFSLGVEASATLLLIFKLLELRPCTSPL